MNLYPAIDLKGGVCVRLFRGDMSKATRFNEDPTDQAMRFIAMGFDNLHIVDLDAAVLGYAANRNVVSAILDASRARVQLGGGIRDIATIESWLEAGVARVILGTVAVRDPDLVKTAARAFPGQVAVGIDARDGRVAVEGWARTTEMLAVDLARAFEGCGIAALIVTDINRDGAKTGVNVEFTGAIADAVSIPVIASGGVASVDDLVRLRQRPGRAIEGAILGRALYEGDIDPAAALAAAL